MGMVYYFSRAGTALPGGADAFIRRRSRDFLHVLDERAHAIELAAFRHEAPAIDRHRIGEAHELALDHREPLRDCRRHRVDRWTRTVLRKRGTSHSHARRKCKSKTSHL